jgi:hypothetical protein
LETRLAGATSSDPGVGWVSLFLQELRLAAQRAVAKKQKVFGFIFFIELILDGCD